MKQIDGLNVNHQIQRQSVNQYSIVSVKEQNAVLGKGERERERGESLWRWNYYPIIQNELRMRRKEVVQVHCSA